jgi:precorrin-2 dehydrogenase/sirohydrochlorin ferrochelatase
MNLDIDGRLAVVVGGGRVAARKVRLFEGTGARVRLVARQVGAAAREAAVAIGADVVVAPFDDEHLDGAFLAVAATDDRDVNRLVATAARERGVLVNVADDPGACDFHVPATIRRGELLVGLSTGGACPGFSHAMKLWLDELLGAEIGVALDVVTAVRERMRLVTGAPPARAAYERLVTDELFRVCRRRDAAALNRLLVETMGADYALERLGLAPFSTDREVRP